MLLVAWSSQVGASRSPQIRPKECEKGVAYPVQSSSYECRDEQDVRRTPVINQDPLHIKISDGSKDDQGIVVGDMQASQVIIGEGNGLMSSSCRRGYVINFFFC